MRYLVAISGICMLLISCQDKSIPVTTTTEDIVAAEKAFADHAKQNGIADAFYTYAADDAVIKRENDTLIKGKENIRNYYSKPGYENASVTWAPDFVNLSDDGTMAYTYGRYVWTVKDSLGNDNNFEGVFHTVWKKQTDSSWKYVWD